MDGKSVVKFIKRFIRSVIEFFYCNRDKVQEGVEKMLNVWIYEMIAIVGLTAGCLGIGFGGTDGKRAGMLGVGPLIFTFILNLFIIGNGFSMMKRENQEQSIIDFPPLVKQLLTINLFIGFLLPFGIVAKTMFYRYFYALYKEKKLYGADPDDSRAERRKKYKEYRAQKRREMDALL